MIFGYWLDDIKFCFIYCYSILKNIFWQVFIFNLIFCRKVLIVLEFFVLKVVYEVMGKIGDLKFFIIDLKGD